MNVTIGQLRALIATIPASADESKLILWTHDSDSDDVQAVSVKSISTYACDCESCKGMSLHIYEE